jgi:hypothetical protein
MHRLAVHNVKTACRDISTRSEVNQDGDSVIHLLPESYNDIEYRLDLKSVYRIRFQALAF